MTDTTKLYIQYYLDDLDFHSRSQLYEQSKTSMSIFSMVDFNENEYVATTYWFVEARAKFILYKL